MNGSKILTSSFLVLLISLLAGVGSGTPLQDDPPEEILPDVKELTTDLGRQYKERRDRDINRILEIYTVFDEIYAKVPPADQKKIVKSIRQAFDIKPPPEDRDFLRAAAACLSQMGDDGLKALLYALDSKILDPRDRSDATEVHDCLEIKATVIESIGFTKNPDAVKPLMKLLWNDEARIIGSACNALGQFNELDLKQKKPIVEELVKVYAYMDAQVFDNPKRADYKERFIAVEVPFNEALKKLTFQSFESSADWQKWYNDNKGKKKW